MMTIHKETNGMADELKDHIRVNMREKDTQELIEIWKKNDRTEWTAEAFDAVREILMERTGELPPQDLAADTEQGEDEISYNESRLTSAASWASLLSWVFLGVGILITLTSLWGTSRNFASYGSILVFISTLVTQLLPAMAGAFFFVVLQVIAEGVYVLMDIENNTRSSARK
jgi:hypothetical protein